MNLRISNSIFQMISTLLDKTNERKRKKKDFENVRVRNGSLKLKSIGEVEATIIERNV